VGSALWQTREHHPGNADVGATPGQVKLWARSREEVAR
jgi:hypothetical protein